MTKKQRELYEINNGKPAPPDKTEIQINCYLLEQKTLENNPEMKGDYNVARAIATFNKRIQPLLVVFKEPDCILPLINSAILDRYSTTYFHNQFLPFKISPKRGKFFEIFGNTLIK